jgi:hypothetical protein
MEVKGKKEHPSKSIIHLVAKAILSSEEDLILQ